MKNDRIENDVERFRIPPSKKRFGAKAIIWIKRFLPAEIAGSALAIIASYFTLFVTHNEIAAAYAGAIGDTTGFYITIIIRSSLTVHKELKPSNNRFSIVHLLQVFKNVVLEFGPAEILDSLFLRPFFMYTFPLLIKNYTLGILAGKIASDISFYIPVIITHELRTFLGNKRKNV